MIRLTQPTIAALVAGFLSTQSIQAAPTWNNPAGGNWSVGGNWNSTTPPGTADNVIFGNVGVGSVNTDDIIGSTINSLTYNQNNQTTATAHTTVINPGQTLTVNSSGAAGTALLYVGNTTTTVGEQVNAAIQGLNSTLNLNGLGDIWVMQGATANGSQHANLDMSQLGTFNATIGRLFVGVNVNGANRHAGSLLLAQTNVITCTGTGVQVELGEAQANGNTGATPANNDVLSFGQSTKLFGNTMRLGGDKCNVVLNFAAALNTAPSLMIRAGDGVSPCTVIDFSYQNGNGGNGTSGSCTADFSAGTVDILSSLVHITQGQPSGGSGTSTATVTLGAGTFKIADLEIGYGNAAGSTGGGTATGTLNVNNNGLFPAGALVTCSTVLNLAHTNGATGTLPVITGTLNVNGGEVDANTITSGGGTSAINLNSFNPGSKLVVTNTAGTLAFPIRNFSMSDATLKIPALNGGASVAVSNLTVGGSANTINISSIPPIGSYPADFTLINYQTGYVPGTGPISLGTKPAGYTGTLVDSVAGQITLHLTAGPVVNLGMLWTAQRITTGTPPRITGPSWAFPRTSSLAHRLSSTTLPRRRTSF